ncbi:hypothetical protein GUJ93_ZPchr0004g38821 [Zizania palustris]|uniref:Uncharacterized protein n=1 Tax=Zizania palustris TaxID=103762 RepID=A0A8J5VG32_ZIZPA|nr:hypothetical protein GUJ93_ZPchr0004g38821 [Zizania palustris]
MVVGSGLKDDLVFGDPNVPQFVLWEGKLRLVRMLVYDPHLPWARHVAHARGVQTTDFFAQPCTVDVFYRDVLVGRVGLPAINGTRSVGS